MAGSRLAKPPPKTTLAEAGNGLLRWCVPVTHDNVGEGVYWYMLHAPIPEVVVATTKLSLFAARLRD